MVRVILPRLLYVAPLACAMLHLGSLWFQAATPFQIEHSRCKASCAVVSHLHRDGRTATVRAELSCLVPAGDRFFVRTAGGPLPGLFLFEFVSCEHSFATLAYGMCCSLVADKTISLKSTFDHDGLKEKAGETQDSSSGLVAFFFEQQIHKLDCS